MRLAPAAALALWALALPAAAQVSGSASLASDYRVRGLSITDRRPALSAGLGDDLASGVYFGASAIAPVDDPEALKSLSHVEYLGYAGRLGSGATWEAGVTNQRYTLYALEGAHLSYSEAYVGLAGDVLGARLSYSPNYNGHDHNVVYLEGNASLRPRDAWRISAHLGVRRALNRWPHSDLRPHYDARVDAVRRIGRVELDFGWAGASPDFGPDPKRSRGGPVVALTAFF